MENKPTEVIEFDVVLPTPSDKLLKSDKCKIELYNNYLTYAINYLVEQEFTFSEDGKEVPSDEFLRKLASENNTVTKKVSKQDEGLVPLKGINFSMEVQNQLNKPNEKTTLVYIVIVEYPGNYLAFYF